MAARHRFAAFIARVCHDTAENGFDLVEAYPEKEVTAKSEDLLGYADMYKNLDLPFSMKQTGSLS